MYTVEAAYVFSITLLVIAGLLTGAIRLQSKINGYTRSVLQEELQSHRPNGDKSFQPENFLRAATLFERDQDPAGGNES